MDAQQNHGGVDAAVDDAGEHTAVLKQPVDADGQLFTQPVGQRADGDQVTGVAIRIVSAGTRMIFSAPG